MHYNSSRARHYNSRRRGTRKRRRIGDASDDGGGAEGTGPDDGGGAVRAAKRSTNCIFASVTAGDCNGKPVLCVFDAFLKETLLTRDSEGGPRGALRAAAGQRTGTCPRITLVYCAV